MKVREFAAWCCVAVLIALLVRCGGEKKTGTVFIPGKTDTLVKLQTDTVAKTVRTPVPYKVYVYMTDSSNLHVENNEKNKCDSIRLYKDSCSNESAKAIVNSTVRGELMGQDIVLETFSHDTTFTRVDTLIIKSPYVYNFFAHVAADLHNGIGVGGALQINRLHVGYTYFLNGSNEIRVGYTIFRR